MENFNIKFDCNSDYSIENKEDTFTLQLSDNNFCNELGKLLACSGLIIKPFNKTF